MVKEIISKQIIDEIVGMNQAISTLNKVVTDKKRRAGFVKRLYFLIIERLFVKAFLNG